MPTPTSFDHWKSEANMATHKGEVLQNEMEKFG